MDIEQISEEEARSHLGETYADPEAAGRFFDELIDSRRKAIDQFAEELNGDERLFERFSRDPMGLLNERRLLGPLDEITLEGWRNPYAYWPWPWPFCRLVCRTELSLEVRWVCIGFGPFRWCWPTFVWVARLVCRIVCD